MLDTTPTQGHATGARVLFFLQAPISSCYQLNHGQRDRLPHRLVRRLVRHRSGLHRVLMQVHFLARRRQPFLRGVSSRQPAITAVSMRYGGVDLNVGFSVGVTGPSVCVGNSTECDSSAFSFSICN